MISFLQQVLSGAAVGCVYALVALGFVLIYKATEVVSFAQGELMMVGAFFGVTFANHMGLPFPVAMLAAIVAVVILGMLLNQVFVRHMIGQPAFAIFMVTAGIGTCLRAIAMLMPGWGVDTYKITTPLTGQVLRFGGLTLNADHAAVAGVTAVCVTGLFLFFRYTRTGLAMQATAENQLAANYAGVNVKAVYAIAWGLGAGLAGLAGLLLAPISFVDVNMGYIGLKAIISAVLGGFGSLPGAVVGGLTIGIFESLAGFYLPEGAKDVAPYALLLVALAVWPRGFFGKTAMKKV